MVGVGATAQQGLQRLMPAGHVGDHDSHGQRRLAILGVDVDRHLGRHLCQRLAALGPPSRERHARWAWTSVMAAASPGEGSKPSCTQRSTSRLKSLPIGVGPRSPLLELHHRPERTAVSLPRAMGRVMSPGRQAHHPAAARVRRRSGSAPAAPACRGRACIQAPTRTACSAAARVLKSATMY